MRELEEIAALLDAMNLDDAAVTIDGQAPMSTTLIVLDADTVRGEDGSLGRRRRPL